MALDVVAGDVEVAICEVRYRRTALLGPGRVDFWAPDDGFGLEGTPKPQIRRDAASPQKKETLYTRAAAVCFVLGLQRNFGS
jgi:hypothetical protein